MVLQIALFRMEEFYFDYALLQIQQKCAVQTLMMNILTTHFFKYKAGESFPHFLNIYVK